MSTTSNFSVQQNVCWSSITQSKLACVVLVFTLKLGTTALNYDHGFKSKIIIYKLVTPAVRWYSKSMEALKAAAHVKCTHDMRLLRPSYLWGWTDVSLSSSSKVSAFASPLLSWFLSKTTRKPCPESLRATPYSLLECITFTTRSLLDPLMSAYQGSWDSIS